jgi:hypothetical protein
MSAGDETFQAKPVRPSTAEDFAESLKRRREAAAGLERDLLTEVPLLYGSPGSLEPNGDPGIVLARVHREELVRRNGGGVTNPSGKRSEVSLPFEELTGALILIFVLFLLLGK